MRIFTLTILIAVVFIGCTKNEPEKRTDKYENIITKYTEIREIISSEVDDTFYIYIRLPKFYNERKENYPVLYLLDGDIAFNMSTSIVRYLQYGKDIPDIIIVGIGYGTMMNDNEQNYRERDYSISKVDRFQNSGGGENFLKFIENELLPTIDNNFRTDSLRILNGYSLGGLAAINSLATKPYLFDYYIAGSPYLINDIDLLSEQVEKLNAFPKMKKLFISVGELENSIDYHRQIKKISEILQTKVNLEVKFQQFENGTHFTCPTEALTYGLKFLFADRKQK